VTHPHYHAVSSARLFDATKESNADFRHRALRRPAEGIFECMRIFSITILNSDGKSVPVGMIGEQHVQEDCGRISTIADWLSRIQPEPWMTRDTKIGIILGGPSHDAPLRHACSFRWVKRL
jgi:hypothetical protein